ncbi:MAG: hypothetical protein M1840_007083 [Geoglossum simile]|nr:MAG: hypothetical protein M1840_007083 [Geoglossum simile]
MAAPTPSFAELASTVSENAHILENYLASADGIPRPTFAPGGPLGFPAPPNAVDVHLARETLIDSAVKILRLALGPVETLFELTSRCHELAALHAIYTFDIAPKVPLDGESSFADIAQAVGLDEDRVCRIIRLSTTSGIFRETRPGFVAHTGVSALLAMPEGMKSIAGHVIDDIFPASGKLVESLQKYPQPKNRQFETPFALANNVGEPFFDYLTKHPARSERFHAAMRATDVAGPFSGASLAQGYDWDALNSKVFVDVGGSSGHTAMRIASRSTIPKFIVQDFNAEEVTKAKEGLDKKYEDRITFMQHDFFKPQPVRDADTYFFRFIFHDWPDKECVQILRNTIPALKKGAKILVCDILLPEPNTTFNRSYRDMRVCDLHMLMLLGSRERDIEMWRGLFEDTDPRFKVLGAKKLPDSAHSIIEVVWEG